MRATGQDSGSGPQRRCRSNKRASLSLGRLMRLYEAQIFNLIHAGTWRRASPEFGSVSDKNSVQLDLTVALELELELEHGATTPSPPLYGRFVVIPPADKPAGPSWSPAVAAAEAPRKIGITASWPMDHHADRAGRMRARICCSSWCTLVRLLVEQATRSSEHAQEPSQVIKIPATSSNPAPTQNVVNDARMGCLTRVSPATEPREREAGQLDKEKPMRNLQKTVTVGRPVIGRRKGTSTGIMAD
ncbi:hypothetical protein CPLU01_02627 [Colletotrichum plurivorum]|uniref:Uncharacterized protein n=1 Tax=Colletotrichum plurivorum TaxID=2175906 RepID=A0A8H6KVZ9_9PEZI|nr:hypothetical protein CPLU01_02627 [Colletotrichum plurivorum]